MREHAGDFLSLATMPDLAVEVTLQPVRRFKLDAAILFSDILLVPWGLGQRLEYLNGVGPVLSPTQLGFRRSSGRWLRPCVVFVARWVTPPATLR